ncbi:hypothetical protein V8C42DRAFT_322649 [Trichoderma barbatum]
MASLSSLPCELSLQIIQLLGFDDKIHLSATCKSYRAQLLPEIFHTIRFSNDESSATSALAALEAHGQYTKAIEFTCQCGQDDEPTAPAPSLLPAACNILEGQLTPNLQMVRLEFDFDLENEDFEVWWDFDFPNSEDYIRAEELHCKWRALMNETWEALAANTFVRELILDELPPKWTSAFLSDAFRQFLGQLESATFNIFGMEDYVPWRTNKVLGCCDFLCHLDDTFFRHMTGLKHLHIQASDPLGSMGAWGERSPDVSFPFKSESLPLLKSLKLENCFICAELVSFIQSHAQVLKSLDINECFGNYMLSADMIRYSFMLSTSDCLSWAEFFDRIYNLKPRFTELIAGGNKVPFTRDDTYEYDDDPVLQPLRQKLAADPALKVFRYMHVNNDTGHLSVDEDINVERFNQGDDQLAYNRLMGLVNENRA